MTAYFAAQGVWGVRVHEVAASKAAVRTTAKLREAGAFSAAPDTATADSSTGKNADE